MFCPACGNQTADNSRFCDHCGAQIEPQKTSTAPPSGDIPSGEQKTPPPVMPPESPRLGNAKFDPIRWMSEAWKLIQSDLANVLVFSLIYVVITAILGGIVIGIFAMPGILAGYMICIMKFVREKKKLDPAEMLQSGWDYYVNVLIFMIVAGILTAIASVCLVIPGMIVGLGFIIPAFMFVDKKADFNTVFNAGIELISKNISGLLIFSVILIAMVIVVAIVSSILAFCGAILAFVLMLFIAPIITIAAFLAYEELFGTKKVS